MRKSLKYIQIENSPVTIRQLVKQLDQRCRQVFFIKNREINIINDLQFFPPNKLSASVVCVCF